MNHRRLHPTLTATAVAVLALTLAACGGGNGDAPPATGGNVVDPAAPVVTITNNVSAETATGDITFTFSFNRDVGTSFTADDITVTGGTKGAFTRLSGTSATLVVVPTPNAAGTVELTVAAGGVTDAVGTANAAASASKAYDTVVPPPTTGNVVLANFDDVFPTVAGYEGAEGSAVENGPAGGGSGRSFKVLRSGGQVYALGIIETAVPVTATRKTISAQVYSPLAGIPMVMKIEGPGGATSGDVAANETVVAGWQTLTWTFSGVDPALSFNKIVLLPRLGTVDAPPGQAYYFDAITLKETVVTPPVTGTVLANFDDVSPPVAGYEGAEGSAVATGPAGGGSGQSFKVLRSGGQVYALGIIETAVPVTASRRTISAQVYSPLAGIPMVMKIEGPGGANSGDVAANETVVAGWQTLTWTFSGVDPALSFNKIVLLPRLGTVDAPPGQSYFFDNIVLLGSGSGGGSATPLVFSSGYTAGGGTAQGGSWGYFSGDFSNYSNTFTGGGFADSTPPVADDAQYFYIAVTTTAPTAQTGTPPNSGGFLGMYVTHPGLGLTGQTSLAVNLGMDANFFQQASNKNIDVFVVGSTTYSNGSGGNCNVTLKGSITPTTDAMITYTLPLAGMTLVQPCNGGGFNSGVTTVAQALAQPIGAVNTQFTFPNVNTTVNSGTAGAPVYATGITRGKTEFR